MQPPHNSTITTELVERLTGGIDVSENRPEANLQAHTNNPELDLEILQEIILTWLQDRGLTQEEAESVSDLIETQYLNDIRNSIVLGDRIVWLARIVTSVTDGYLLGQAESLRPRTQGKEFTFILRRARNLERRRYQLTPRLLQEEIAPYLAALADIQDTIKEIIDQQNTGLLIYSISQHSPITVSISSNVTELIEAIKNTIIPSRRQRASRMVELSEAEKLVDIEMKKAQVLEVRARADNERRSSAAELALKQAEAEKLLAEADRIRQESNISRVKTALEIIAQLSPNLPEEKKMSYVVKLLGPLNTVIDSDFEAVL